MTTKRTTLTEDARRRREFVLQGTGERQESPTSPSAPKQEPPEEEPTVNQSYRLPKSLVNRLRRAVLERKNASVQPSSANAIAAEALARWLDEEEKRTRHLQ
jgi:hypothetical protein